MSLRRAGPRRLAGLRAGWLVGAAFTALLVAHRAAGESQPPDGKASEPPTTYFHLGWDQGPTYELGQRFPVLRSVDPTGVIQDVRLRGRIGGKLELDGGYLAGTAISGDGWKGKVRSARLLTTGDFRYGLDTEYKFEFAVEGSSVLLNDFYLLWRLPRWADTVKVGYFDPPIGLDVLSGSSARPLIEPASPGAALAPGNRSGVEVAGHFDHPSLAWALSLSSVGQTQPLGSSSSTQLRATGRLVWRPWLDEKGPRPSLLHLGISVGYEFAGSGSLKYRAEPESFLAPYLLDTGKISGNAATLGAEAAWRRGPLTIQGELLETFVNGGDVGTLVFSGVYAQASWVLTGESRPYDARRGQFLRIEPARPFAPLEGRWGALVLSERVSWLNLSDGPVRGGRMLTVSLGPEWILNRWVRVLAGYVFASTGGRPGAGNAQIAQARLELSF